MPWSAPLRIVESRPKARAPGRAATKPRHRDRHHLRRLTRPRLTPCEAQPLPRPETRCPTGAHYHGVQAKPGCLLRAPGKVRGECEELTPATLCTAPNILSASITPALPPVPRLSAFQKIPSSLGAAMQARPGRSEDPDPSGGGPAGSGQLPACALPAGCRAPRACPCCASQGRKKNEEYVRRETLA